jgi:diacylglycerol kinase (ATP)
LRIDVIVNTTARHFRESSLLEQVRVACAGRAELHPTASLRELDDVAAGLAARGSDVVALAGGDGTLMAGATALWRAFGEAHMPALAVIPAGTAGTVAKNWGATGSAMVALRGLFAAACEAALPTTERATLRVREEGPHPAPAVERIGFIFGTGLVASFFDEYYATGARGYPGAAAIVARVFAGSFVGSRYARKVLDPLPCTIEVDGRTLPPRAWSLVCASVVRDLGIHMQVTYRAGEDPARLHLVASPLGPGALGPRAPLVLLGKRIGGRQHFDDLVCTFTVRFAGTGGRGATESGPYVLDGDMLRAASVTVSVGPRLRFVSA